MMWQENIVNTRMKLSISTFYVERADDVARKYRKSPNEVINFDILCGTR